MQIVWHFLGVTASSSMGFLKDLLIGHEAFFAASDAEKGWDLPNESTNSETTEGENKSD